MGHVNTDNHFGKLLYKLGTDTQFKTYVDIGTWNGQGTTLCIMTGILEKNPTAKLHSLEANVEMYMRAFQFWGSKYPQLNLIHGTLHKKLMPINDVLSNPMFYKYLPAGDKYKEWYNDEANSVLTAKIVDIPENEVDVVVIDGGEYSADGDWEVLETKNPKIVCLDDSQAVKAYNLKNRLLSSSHWDLVIDTPSDRNGWTIFKRKDVTLPDNFLLE